MEIFKVTWWDINQMSNLWRFLSSFLIAILGLGLVSSLELGASPPEIEFKGKVGEEICKNMVIYSYDEEMKLYLSDYWLNDSRFVKDLRFYNSDKEGDFLFYNGELVVDGERREKICFIADSSGKKNGVIIVDGGLLSVGVWISADIEGENAESTLKEEKGAIFAGSVIKEGSEGGILEVLAFSSGLLLVISFILVVFLVKKKR